MPLLSTLHETWPTTIIGPPWHPIGVTAASGGHPGLEMHAFGESIVTDPVYDATNQQLTLTLTDPPTNGIYLDLGNPNWDAQIGLVNLPAPTFATVVKCWLPFSGLSAETFEVTPLPTKLRLAIAPGLVTFSCASGSGPFQVLRVVNTSGAALADWGHTYVQVGGIDQLSQPFKALRLGEPLSKARMSAQLI